MRTVLFGTLFAVGLAFVGTAEAGHKVVVHKRHFHGHHYRVPHYQVRHYTPVVRTPYHGGYTGGYTRGYTAGYHLRYGVKFSHGYYYQGHNHVQWKYVVQSPTYGCRLYFCPCADAWYYWHPVRECYYPVNYFNYARPF